MTTGVMNTFGFWTGLCDRNGRRVHIGDTLEFDPTEWGGDNETIVQFEDGELNVLGGISAVAEWSVVTKGYNE